MIEDLFAVLFLCVLFFLFGVIYAYLQPYCRYCLYKSKNKIEWKCEETGNNYDQRIKKPFAGKPKIEFDICYRIKSSEVNWLVRTFGDNDWYYPFSSSFWFYEESAEEAFKNITKNYVTLEDVRKLERKKHSKSEKIKLLSSLLNDSDTIAFVEAEFQNRLKYVLDDIYKELDLYLMSVSKLNQENIDRQEAFIALGRSEVCARIKTLLDIKMEKPSLEDQGYTLIKDLQKRKDEIVDNELSDYFRQKGLRTEYHKMLQFEAKCADILEAEWNKAFFLGLDCKDRVSEERIQKIRNNELCLKNSLLHGIYYYCDRANRIFDEYSRKMGSTFLRSF